MPNWHNVLDEIQKAKFDLSQTNLNPADRVRRKYLKSLHDKTGRNVIAYYSGFLTKEQIVGLEINDDDKNSFMTCVNSMDRDLGLDLILHTPGGGVAEVQSLVYYLRKMFGRDIRAMVPQLSMSAGTMLALSCKSVVMGKQSALGPIDPHIGGLPADLIVGEFNRALREIKEDAAAANVWVPILSKYSPTYLSQCENALTWAEEFMQKSLEECMLFEKQNANELSKEIVKKLLSAKHTKAHNKHIHADELTSMGVVVESLEEDNELQDILLTVHHCYMHSLSSTNLIKAVENHEGRGILRTISPRQT